MDLTWCGIAPFGAECAIAGGYLDPKSMYKPNVPRALYVDVSGVCPVCKLPFTRSVVKSNASRVELCGSDECKKARDKETKRRSKELRKGNRNG